MGALEQEKNKLVVLEEKQEKILLNIRDVYELDEDYCDSAGAVEECIYGGDVTLEWSDSRDLDYIDDMIRCQQMLVRAMNLFEQGDKKSLHNANKAFEALLREARRIKKEKNDDIQKAKDVISTMDEIIKNAAKAENDFENMGISSEEGSCIRI